MTDVRTMTAARLADALRLPPPTAQQAAVIEAPLAPALVVAGAGSGKTETMALRVVHLVATGRAEASQILGLTFTRKAASELGERIGARLRMLGRDVYDPFDPPVVATYNSFAAGLYRDAAPRIGREADGVVLGEAAAWQLARRVVVESEAPLGDLDLGVDRITQLVLDLANGLGEHAASSEAVRAMAERYGRALDGLTFGAHRYQDDVDGAGLPARTLPVLTRLVEAFQQAKRQLGAVQFSDQVALGLQILDAAPDVGDELRARHRVVLLDEYQDTSVVQTRLLSRLFRGGAVMAVGDPHQSIYGWRGASAANLEGFAADFGGAGGAARFALSTSWRNGTRILDAANALAAPLSAGAGVRVERLAPSPRASREPVESLFAQTLDGEADGVAAWFRARLTEAADRGEPPPTAAMLVRARRELPSFLAAFDRARLPYHVLGVGGLLLEPEVADLVCALRVVHDATAGPELVRLLAGGRWRIGPADLVALQRLARWLADHDPTEQRLPEHVAAVLDRSLAEGESASVVDALDFLARRAGHGAVRGFSTAGLARMADAGRLFAGLRARSGGDLATFVRHVVETLGLDVEVGANELRGRPAPLQAFDEALSGYLGVAEAGTLGGFLAWLVAAEQKEDLSPRSDPPEPGTVQILTIHGSKGLEWDAVAVPRMVKDELPAKPQSSLGWLAAGVLPFEFRGDAAEQPVLPWRALTTRQELKGAVAAFKSAVAQGMAAEERRLAYVAVTRARHRLLLSGSFWGRQRLHRGPSVYLAELAEAGIVPPQPDAPTSPDRPEDAPPELLTWPRDPLGTRRAEVARAADAVRAAAGAADDAGGPWARMITDLLDERARQRAPRPAVIPDRIPASRFKDYVDDAAAVVDATRRPMPERPYRATRLGTVFHAWVEERSGLPGTDELVDAAAFELDGDDAATDALAGLAALQATFESSEWGPLEPLEVETEIQVPFEGHVLVCKIDAVYRRVGEDGSQRIEIVDWKTGAPPRDAADAELKQLQLALYRFAYAQRHGLDPAGVEAAFYFVAHDRVVRPERIYSPEELRAAWRAAVAADAAPLPVV